MHRDVIRTADDYFYEVTCPSRDILFMMQNREKQQIQNIEEFLLGIQILSTNHRLLGLCTCSAVKKRLLVL